MEFLIKAVWVVATFAVAAVFCITCDQIEQRWRRWRFRKQMQLKPDISEQQFAASFNESDRATALGMRRLLAEILGIDPLKIRPELRLREEPHLRPFEGLIFHLFATTYAPQSLDRKTFQFPTKPVSTVEELFLEALRLQNCL